MAIWTLRLIASSSLLLCSMHALAVDAPAPIFDEGIVFWEEIEGAKAINVHKGDGEFVESIPGFSFDWFPHETGDYFFVATDDGEWQDWGRSETINVPYTIDDGFDSNPDLTLIDVHAIVYSETAAEIFWQTEEGAPSMTVELSRFDGDGGLETFTTDGRSFFDNTLRPGSHYIYDILPYDDDGNFGDFYIVEFTTPGIYRDPTDVTPPVDPELPPLPDIYYFPLPPENLRAEVYSTSALELFWDHAADYYDHPIEYHVYQDDQEIATIDGGSLFIDGLVAGREYVFQVEAVTDALNTSEKVTITAQTRGAPLREGYGKPDGNRDTHRFDLWDNMSTAEAAYWPSDCLFAAKYANLFFTPEDATPEICFSPSTRSLIHKSDYNFVLPGDNASNNVEAIEWFIPQHFGLVTDISTSFPETSYELSVFKENGNFEGTYPILESVALSGPQGLARKINLDGKNVRVTNTICNRSCGNVAKELIVIAEYWQAIPGQSSETLSGWSNEGAFISWLDPLTGDELQTTFYSGRTASSITEEELIR